MKIDRECLFAGNRYRIELALLLWAVVSAGSAADFGAGGEAEALIHQGITLDRGGDFAMARRVFLEVLQTLDRSVGSRENPEVRAVRQRLQENRDDYPALAAALNYHDLLVASPAGEWVMLHEQQPTDAVTFVRQRHAGSAFDSKRGRLILFGSDTHGRDWQNSPLYFDPALGEWSRAYADDPPATYAVDDSGVPVAGANQDHPWAMHTFGSVCYDAARDQLIIASYPEHMEQGRFTDVLSRLWGQVSRHPTWVFDLLDSSWSPLPGRAISFFPYAAVYDSDRSVVIGYKATGIYELSGSPRGWTKIIGGGLAGWHNNAVYDSRDKLLIGFGSHEDSNDIVVYEPSTGRHQKMPTAGERPPKAQHVPMAFHPGIGRTVVLVAGTRDASSPVTSTETWLYDFRSDEWLRAETARLPFAIGMNYNLEYDSMRDVLLFVAGSGRRATTVWALRL